MVTRRAVVAAACLVFLANYAHGQCITCAPSNCNAAGDGVSSTSSTFPARSTRRYGTPGKQGPAGAKVSAWACLFARKFVKLMFDTDCEVGLWRHILGEVFSFAAGSFAGLFSYGCLLKSSSVEAIVQFLDYNMVLLTISILSSWAQSRSRRPKLIKHPLKAWS